MTTHGRRAHKHQITIHLIVYGWAMPVVPPPHDVQWQSRGLGTWASPHHSNLIRWLLTRCTALTFTLSRLHWPQLASRVEAPPSRSDNARHCSTSYFSRCGSMLSESTHTPTRSGLASCEIVDAKVFLHDLWSGGAAGTLRKMGVSKTTYSRIICDTMPNASLHLCLHCH